YGKHVLGIHRTFDIQGVPFSLIAEIEESAAYSAARKLAVIVYSLLFITILAVVFIALFASRKLVSPIQLLSKGAKMVAGGQLEHEINIEAENEIGELAASFNEMLSNLHRTTEENKAQNRLMTGQAELNAIMRGELKIAVLATSVISYLAQYLDAQIGAIYMSDEQSTLNLIGSYAYTLKQNTANSIQPGEGLIGQVALEKKHIIITDCPDDYINIQSGLGESVPRCILVYPLLSGNKIRGVIELGTLNTINGNHLTFLEKVSESIAITLHSLAIRNRTNVLLEKTQKQAEQLGSHQEELREANSELEENTKALKASEAKLQAQQEELQQTNEELEEQTLRLEEQKNDIEKKNTDLELAGKQIEEKAHDLEMSSKYKSEFLANMSHELRTPLNSILLLSRLLVDNSTGNLKEDQVESAKSVYESGSELLTLINEILDLSKVESGKIELFLEPVEIKEFCFTMDYNFKQLAKEKGLKWNLELEEGLPTHIYTDAQRSKQIVTNFISNAFKFTTKGSVTLRIGRPHTHLEAGRTLAPETLDIKKGIAFTVNDTGAGIPEEKQKIIFEAFQQADGTTSRKYGGTGLGLSISRELAKLLQGEIHMKSTPGKGSTFALYLPETIKKEEQDNKDIQKENYARRQPELRAPGTIGRNSRQKYVEAIEDDRKSLTPQDKSVLIIEDDPTFLKVLRDLAREHGFKCVLAGDGETGLHSTDLYNPSAIILDIGLPRIDGWGVMARLKENPKTRHIPVHFISAADKTIEALKMGAIDFLTKPVNPEMLEKVYEKLEKTISKPVKELLIVEDNKQQADAIEKIIGAGDIQISKATSASEALEQLENGDFDCLILDLGLPDKSGVELLDNIRNNPEIKQLPIIVYTGMELSKEQKTIIDRYAESTIIKSANSHQRLLDETTLFLHRVEADMPSEQQKIMRMLHDKETILSGKRILVVDDDMRNVFSLKKVLSEKGIEVLVGKNGKEGLDVLENNPEIDLVLMDIMMPVMDGYEAIAGIRNQQKFADLPVIALTAKAMKGDRSKCIEVGASDYLAKPVDTDRLFSMLRVWLY
ncbi:MAG: response regulator, partial [bacterium]|nr:response regulator [bacterium]